MVPDSQFPNAKFITHSPDSETSAVERLDFLPIPRVARDLCLQCIRHSSGSKATFNVHY